MKKFNLEEAKAGKPVCTRDGRKVRIVCFDRKCGGYPIIALVETDGDESIFSCTIKGEYVSGNESNTDLMMAPEKKEGWINIYRNEHEYYNGPSIFKTKEDAICNAHCQVDPNYVATTKVEWEE